MPARWIACPYLRRDGQTRPGAIGRWMIVASRLEAGDPWDFADMIAADGGAWDYFECGGGPTTEYLCGIAMVKVRATQATLDAIIAAPLSRALPATLVELGTSMSVLGNAAKLNLRDDVMPAVGYTLAEQAAWLGISQGASNATWAGAFNSKTLGQFLDFLASKWYRVVYEPTGTQPEEFSYSARKGGSPEPGVVACDGRTTTNGMTSAPWTPIPRTPADVAASVSSS